MQEQLNYTYVLGHSEHELARLRQQARLIGGITENLLATAGLRPGMRVLDIGCGTGEVARIAARMVGASGTVLGLDFSSTAIATATNLSSDIKNLRFEVGSLESPTIAAKFDMVVGRYVLIHQNDPVGFVNAARCLVADGGIIAFHEIDLMDTFTSFPEAPLWLSANRWLMGAFQARLMHPDIARRLVACFAGAGIFETKVSCSTPVGDAQSLIPAWLANTLRSMMNVAIETQDVTADEIAIETLEARLREAAAERHAQVFGPRQVCVWARA